VVKEYKIRDMAEKIQILKQTATELKRISGGIQAVDRNVDHILASIKMLEINISDLTGIL
jgi:prefoldin subunit 5